MRTCLSCISFKWMSPWLFYLKEMSFCHYFISNLFIQQSLEGSSIL